MRTYYVLINVLLVLSSLLVDNLTMFNYGHCWYFIQLFATLIFLYLSRAKFLIYLTPSFLSFIYLSLSSSFGHYVTSREIGLTDVYYTTLVNIHSMSMCVFVLLLSNFAIILSLFPILAKTKRVNLTGSFESRSAQVGSSVIILLGLIGLLNFVNIDLSFVGLASRGYIFPIQLCLCIFLFLKIRYLQSKPRLFIYVILMALTTIGNYDSKRQIFFILITIVFFECVINKAIFNNLKLNAKIIGLSLCAFVLFTYIILISSILRGYGGYKFGGFFEANSFIFEYMKEDFFADALVSNLELSSSYVNTVNPINYVVSGEQDLLYGSTVVKGLFVLLPSSVIQKPQSIINIYTSIFSPAFREEGGSLPVTLPAEFFWNFFVFSFPLLGLFYYLLNTFYLKLIDGIVQNKYSLTHLMVFFLYATFMQIVRGSGIDLWFAYCIIALPFMIIFKRLFSENLGSKL
jgi:hypothetical protein